jgi:hypothetical protein
MESGNRRADSHTARVVDRLNAISEPPIQVEAFNAWLEMGNAFDFLRDDAQENEFAVWSPHLSRFTS